jgi:hypothetical protein
LAAGDARWRIDEAFRARPEPGAESGVAVIASWATRASST